MQKAAILYLKCNKTFLRSINHSLKNKSFQQYKKLYLLILFFAAFYNFTKCLTNCSFSFTLHFKMQKKTGNFQFSNSVVLYLFMHFSLLFCVVLGCIFYNCLTFILQILKFLFCVVLQLVMRKLLSLNNQQVPIRKFSFIV